MEDKEWVLKTIEALQQENKGWRERYDELDAGHSRLFKDFCKLQQENERLKEQINTAKIGWDTYETYSEQLEQQITELKKIIETQQQEIEKLKTTIADWKYNAKCDADHIAALTTDNDELVKELKQARKSLQEVLQDFYQYIQGGKEICAFCLYDDECELGETMCGATYKGFKWRGLNEKEEL